MLQFLDNSRAGEQCGKWMGRLCLKRLESVRMQVQLFRALVAPILKLLLGSLGPCPTIQRGTGRALICAAHVDQPTACCSV